MEHIKNLVDSVQQLTQYAASTQPQFDMNSLHNGLRQPTSIVESIGNFSQEIGLIAQILAPMLQTIGLAMRQESALQIPDQRNRVTQQARALGNISQQLGVLLTVVAPYLNLLDMGAAPGLAQPVEPLTSARLRHVITPDGNMFTYQISNSPAPNPQAPRAQPSIQVNPVPRFPPLRGMIPQLPLPPQQLFHLQGPFGSLSQPSGLVTYDNNPLVRALTNNLQVSANMGNLNMGSLPPQLLQCPSLPRPTTQQLLPSSQAPSQSPSPASLPAPSCKDAPPDPALEQIAQQAEKNPVFSSIMSNFSMTLGNSLITADKFAGCVENILQIRCPEGSANSGPSSLIQEVLNIFMNNLTTSDLTSIMWGDWNPTQSLHVFLRTWLKNQTGTPTPEKIQILETKLAEEISQFVTGDLMSETASELPNSAVILQTTIVPLTSAFLRIISCTPFPSQANKVPFALALKEFCNQAITLFTGSFSSKLSAKTVVQAVVSKIVGILGPDVAQIVSATIPGLIFA